MYLEYLIVIALLWKQFVPATQLIEYGHVADPLIQLSFKELDDRLFDYETNVGLVDEIAVGRAT